MGDYNYNKFDSIIFDVDGTLCPAEVPASKSSTDGKPRKGYEKKAQVGDIIVMTGGRIGKDGIHGATFSSEELHEGSPATAVQIGDPITQRKMYDFIMRARDLGLYNAITDNGAGGLSSSIGEMAEDTNGCRIDLARAPLKYDGLRPWEILLSEAQERMTLAVPPAALDEFLALAKRMDVEATPLGEFTDDGVFHVTYNGKLVTHLDMEFMHDGVPQYQLNAVWEAPVHPDSRIEDGGVDQAELLKAMLGRLNICSKEYLIRQYDHEVKGGSVVKPLTGVKRDGPSDAGVIRPILESEAGLVISHGICPKYSDYDAYWMMANAMDEGIRNAVAVGADPDRMAGVDNFCWCDPVQSEKTPDGEYKLAQLVRACKALSELCVAYGVPCISGKDSMKTDILKYELGVNAVRTSHYPQSPYFIDQCDRIGLLVFMEIPGWQHIGDEAWKNQAVINVRDMVMQYRNHTSIILWGVRINESQDDDDFYRRTNAAAHELDPSRPTGGVRAHKKSSFLEDVYTYNDFVHDGTNRGSEKKTSVTSDPKKPYLISEYNGHMYPTKAFDWEEHRVEHALRHVRVLDAAAAEGDIAGSFGWCMFDYNTHKDFGSGDRP